MPQVNETEARVLRAMSGAERIRMLLRDAGFRTLSAFAFEISSHAQSVSFCINGERTCSRVRDALAVHLGLERAEIDAMIDGPPGASI